MPTLARASPERELQRLIRLYLKAETDIINEIGRLRSRGLVDYHAVAALERVQEILRKLETGSPPRGRGKDSGTVHGCGQLRITPAWAGKRARCPCWCAGGQDHPRVGGEKSLKFAMW